MREGLGFRLFSGGFVQSPGHQGGSMAEGQFGVGFYSPRVAARVARISYQHFQAWAKAGLLHATKFPAGKKGENVYTYHDLLLIRLIVRLKAQGIRPRNIKIALNTINLMSGGDHDAWLMATIYVTDGVVVAILPEKPEWSPIAVSRGPQKMAVVFFPELIAELKEELVPRARFPYIDLNPAVLGGTPVIRGTRVSVKAVLSVLEAGEDPTKAFPDITWDEVRNAEEYDRFLQAA